MFNFFMSSLFSVFFLVFGLQTVQATIYVTAPLEGSECQGGQPCTVQWLDNGAVPLLSTIGACHVGLYNGNQVLVQQIDPVNVASVHSFQFTPDPKAGPSSNTYYINFTSLNPIGTNNYQQYSPFFKLSGMSGSFASPLASATSALPVPSSVASASPNSVSVTVTVGASSTPSANQTSSPTPSPLASSSEPASTSSGPSGAPSASQSSPSSPASSIQSSISSHSASASSLASSSSPAAPLSSSSGSSSRASSTFTTSRITSATSSPAAASVASPSSTTSSASLSAEFRLIPAALAVSMFLSLSFL